MNLYHWNQMHKNCKFDEQVITNFIHRHIKPIEQQKQMKLIIYYTRSKASKLIVKNNTNSLNASLKQTNLVYEFTCPFRECLLEKKIKINT